MRLYLTRHKRSVQAGDLTLCVFHVVPITKLVEYFPSAIPLAKLIDRQPPDRIFGGFWLART